MSVTRLGVSLLKVVATIDSPASHHGTDRPEAKNSVVLLPARLPKNNAGRKQTNNVTRTIIQSMRARCISSNHRNCFSFLVIFICDCPEAAGLLPLSFDSVVNRSF